MTLGPTQLVAWRTAGYRRGEGYWSRVHERIVGFNAALCGAHPPPGTAARVVETFVTELTPCGSCRLAKARRLKERQ